MNAPYGHDTSIMNRQGRVVLIIGPRSFGKQILVDVVRLDVRPVLDDLWHVVVVGS